MAVVAIAAAGVGGYVFLRSPGIDEAIIPPEPPPEPPPAEPPPVEPPPEPPPEPPTQIFTLESVTILGDSRAKATWAVWNPSTVTVGVYRIFARFDANWNLDPYMVSDIRIKNRVMLCTDIGPGQTVLVDQEFEIYQIQGGAQVPFPQDELESVTDWQSGGGLAEFTEGGCGTGGQTLCAVVEGGIFENSCGDQPTLEP